MKINRTLIFYLFILSLLLIPAANCQSIGKIYSRTVADSLYGKVYSAYPISTSKMKSYCSKTSGYILFNIIQGKLIITDNKRDIIPSDTTAISDTLVLKVCSASKMLELLTKGEQAETYIEQRKKVLTVTNGGYTIEELFNCPPHCP